MAGRLRDRVEGEALRVLKERVTRLRLSLDEALAGLAEPLRFPLTPGEWGAAEGSSQLQSLRDATEAIARGSSQREILTALLDGGAAFYPRTAVFIVKGERLTGWAGLGFLGDGGFTSEALPKVTLPAKGDHLLAEALKGRGIARAGSEGPGHAVIASLGGVSPAQSCAVVLQVRGRAAAALYGDTGVGGAAGQSLALEILARLAGLSIERLTASPTTATPEGRAGARTLDGEGSPAPRRAAAGGVRSSAPRRGTPTPPEEAEMQALLGDLEGFPRRTAADDGLSDEERRRHADARRFAHLLVSELLLYNEDAVIQGRKHRDLQERLRKEIERSRQAFEARIAGLSPRATSYFEDELVKQLALGDPALLRN